MIHRVVFGSIERFIGILIEHFAGAFPAWLAPVQVKVIPISEAHHAYAKQVEQELRDAGLRVEGDYRAEKMGYKIREAQLEKIPYMLVVGAQGDGKRYGERACAQGGKGRHKNRGGIQGAGVGRGCQPGALNAKGRRQRPRVPIGDARPFLSCFCGGPPQNGQNSSCIRRAMARI